MAADCPNCAFWRAERDKAVAHAFTYGPRLSDAVVALEEAADHFEQIEAKALSWMQVFANSELGEARWSQIKRWAGHRGREARAAIAKASA